MSVKKYLLAGLAFLALLFISAVLVLYYNVDVIKRSISEQVAANTPFTLHFQPDSQWYLNRPFSLRITDLQLQLGEDVVLDKVSIAATLKIRGLLKGHIHISQLDFSAHKCKVSEEHIRRIGNYFQKPKSLSRVTTSNGDAWLQQLSLDTVKLQIKQLRVQQPEHRLLIEQLELNISNAKLPFNQQGEPLLAQLAFASQLHAKQIDLDTLTLQQLSLSSRVQNKQADNTLALNFQQGKISSEFDIRLQPEISSTVQSLIIDNLVINAELLAQIKQLGGMASNSEEKPAAEVADTTAAKLPLHTLFIHKLQLNDIQIDLRNSRQLSLEKLSAEITQIPLISQQQLAHNLQTFSSNIEANISAEELRFKQQHISSIRLHARQEQQLVHTELQAIAYGSQLQSHLVSNLADARLRSQLQATLSDFDIQSLSKNTNYPSEGKVSFATDIALDLLPEDDIISSIEGDIHVLGRNLLVNKIDIDKLVKTIESSQSVSWADIGAVGMLGPIGLLYATAFSVGTDSIKKGQGYSNIQAFDINASIKNNEINFSDNLINTGKSLVAFKGTINYKKELFQQFEFAFLDKNLCPVFKQKVSGTFSKPNIQVSNFLTGTIMNTAGDILTLRPLIGKSCPPYYRGFAAKAANDKTLPNAENIQNLESLESTEKSQPEG